MISKAAVLGRVAAQEPEANAKRKATQQSQHTSSVGLEAFRSACVAYEALTTREKIQPILALTSSTRDCRSHECVFLPTRATFAREESRIRGVGLRLPS